MGVGFYAEYKREAFYVRTGKDVRERSYFFLAGNKTKAIGAGEHSTIIPDPGFSIESSSKDIENFQKNAGGKLVEWLKEQGIN